MEATTNRLINHNAFFVICLLLLKHRIETSDSLRSDLFIEPFPRAFSSTRAEFNVLWGHSSPFTNDNNRRIGKRARSRPVARPDAHSLVNGDARYATIGRSPGRVSDISTTAQHPARGSADTAPLRARLTMHVAWESTFTCAQGAIHGAHGFSCYRRPADWRDSLKTHWEQESPASKPCPAPKSSKKQMGKNLFTERVSIVATFRRIVKRLERFV
jgi:hypothetical protein